MKKVIIDADAITLKKTLKNGMQAGGLTVLAGRPGMGKSTFAADIAESFDNAICFDFDSERHFKDFEGFLEKYDEHNDCHFEWNPEKQSCLILIDYLQQIEEKLSSFCKKLKRFAELNNVHILVLSQVSKKADNRKNHIPKLRDLRKWGRFDQHADNVLAVIRKSYYSSDADLITEKDCTHKCVILKSKVR